MCLSYASNYTLLMFDKKGRRFLFYDGSSDYGMGMDDRKEIVEGGGSADNIYLTGTQNNRNTLQFIEDKGGDQANLFDPSDIPSGIVIDDMEATTGNRSSQNVMAIGHEGNTFHIYEFSMSDITGKDAVGNPNCSGYWTFSAEGNLSADEDGKIPATTSNAFTRQMFYAAGNSIYKVDLTVSPAAPKLIWSSDDASDVVTGLKFKSDNEDISYDTETEIGLVKGINNDLGAIVRHSDGSCDLVEFSMTSGGEIERDAEGAENIQTFSGFHDVKDFVFSYREYIR